jgi:hypothetical protein
MPNMTFSLDEDLIKLRRKYAEAQKTSLNGIIRMRLEHSVKGQSSDWLEECFRLMDRSGANSEGKHWRGFV